jgi:uncharacterized protein (DUF1697 family)
MAMTTYITMLRGINVGGQKKTSMTELKGLYESLGLKNVRTYIQSGNVIFESAAADPLELKTRIERGIKETFGYETAVFIRTRDDFQRLIKKTPYSKKDPGKRHVTFLSDIPRSIPLDEIERIKDTSEEFAIAGREIYLFLPNGSGNTKLSNAFFEKKLNVGATTRNWNTVLALYAASDGTKK